VDALTMIAHALVWGLDCLANIPESRRYERTPRECYNIIQEVRSIADAGSPKLLTELPRKLDLLDHIQQVLGAATMNVDEILAALQEARLSPSGSPELTIRHALSTNSSIFRREWNKSGVCYRLHDGNSYRTSAPSVEHTTPDVM
jgi:hypothetical protein